MTRGERMLAGLAVLRVAASPHDEIDGRRYRMHSTDVLLRHTPTDGDGELVDLLSIETPAKGLGYGTAALNLLCGLADVHDVTLVLYARAFDDKPASTRRAVRWYCRHGFEITGDMGLDWRAPDDLVDPDHTGCDMMRAPVRHHHRQVT